MTKHKFTRQDAITLKNAVGEALNHMDMLMYPIEETIDSIEAAL